jgi:hypothetical protein
MGCPESDLDDPFLELRCRVRFLVMLAVAIVVALGSWPV